MPRPTLGLTLVLALFATAAAGQSLGELAKQEEARRKAIKSSGKVYTNDTLGEAAAAPPAAPAPTAVPPSPSGIAPEASAAPAGVAAAAPDPPAGAEVVKDEAYWRQRLGAAQDALRRAELFAEALQSRINALTADFTARDDPAQRAVVAADRQKALAELERVRQEVQEGTKAIAAVREEARRAGVPPGWLR